MPAVPPVQEGKAPRNRQSLHTIPPSLPQRLPPLPSISENAWPSSSSRNQIPYGANRDIPRNNKRNKRPQRTYPQKSCQHRGKYGNCKARSRPAEHHRGNQEEIDHRTCKKGISQGCRSRLQYDQKGKKYRRPCYPDNPFFLFHKNIPPTWIFLSIIV